jgi:hypothetical protein
MPRVSVHQTAPELVARDVALVIVGPEDSELLALANHGTRSILTTNGEPD